MLRKDLLQEGWLEISCKNTSPLRFIMKLYQSFFILDILLVMQIKTKTRGSRMRRKSHVRFWNGDSLNRMTTVTNVSSIRRKLCPPFFLIHREKNGGPVPTIHHRRKDSLSRDR